MLLYGDHDNARAFYNNYAITSVLDALHGDRSLEPSLIVPPDGNDNRGSSPLFDSVYSDGPNGRMSTLIGSDLVQVLQKRYRTSSGTGSWALGGFSSGGWGALTIGLRHLDHFGTLFSHDGYFTDAAAPPTVRTCSSARCRPNR
ncbi:alpha/beta hydrolase-fold protein [Cyanobium sp. Morenito 9A2]|uniref:alpha/beta hydrolase n=1 Tax=Cyanobium sp. Morenito 9A2 TaxID=2823718 RepID=UPI0020CDCE0E|nr:alpha/beta hydrolase-fold protein [Cyanobium sp. Morenito 9A2]MCP9849465.1 hypothetical protein [Cyanobium sp. Morenito 9A2]